MTIMKEHEMVGIRSLRAQDVMSAPAVVCREHAFFEEVAEALAERNLSGMPVVDASGTVVGVISERDLAHALGSPLVRLIVRRSHGPKVMDLADIPREARRARDLMTTPPLTCSEDASLEELAATMAEEDIARLPVVRDGRLVGIVTRGDVLRALGGQAHAAIALDRPMHVIGSGSEVCARPSIAFGGDRS